MNWRFAYPSLLYLIAVLPVIWIIMGMLYSRKQGIPASAPSRFIAAGRSARTLTLWVPHGIMSICICSLLVALARPQEVLDFTKTTRDTIALELVVDRSGSMDERVEYNGRTTNRLEAVKQIVEQFVAGDDSQFTGRAGDLLGLIVFGTYADTLMPLTQTHDVLIEAIRRIELPEDQREQSTAIGDALMLAAARLKATEDSMRREMKSPEFKLKSKAIILLTDGENRTGSYSPQQAAALAKDWGVRIYIIGIRSPVLFGGNRQRANDRKMEQVAQYTGGQYWGVSRMADLAGVYAQIDELERSTIEVSESTSYRELYLPFVTIGLLAYVVSTFLKLFVYRSVL